MEEGGACAGHRWGLLALHPYPERSAEQPGLLGLVFRLVRANLLGVLERTPDLVQPLGQLLLVEGVDVEAKAMPSRCGNSLRFQVHRQPVTGNALDLAE